MKSLVFFLSLVFLCGIVGCNCDSQAPPINTSHRTPMQLATPEPTAPSQAVQPDPDAASHSVPPSPSPVPPSSQSRTVLVKTDDGQFRLACGQTFSWNQFQRVLSDPIGGAKPDYRHKMEFRSTGLMGRKPEVVICPVRTSPAQCWDQEATKVAPDGSFTLKFYKRESNMGWHRFKLDFGPEFHCYFTIDQ